MAMDVNPAKLSAIELVNISASSAAAATAAAATLNAGYSHRYNNNNNNNNNSGGYNGSAVHSLRSTSITNAAPFTAAAADAAPTQPETGCCGILGLLLRSSRNGGRRTASSSIGDYNSFGGGGVVGGTISSISGSGGGSMRKTQQRRTPQEVYFESRGKSCKKLLKFNGSSNKILLYPEEGWARTASSSYWTMTPCWWQPNRCRIEEFMGATQRRSAKAKMVPLEQKGSLLIAGSFGRRSKSKSRKQQPSFAAAAAAAAAAATSTTAAAAAAANTTAAAKEGRDDEFKLYLSSNISTEDYNMGYCLTGFVERRCPHTNAFQMTHFAVIKRQWPSIASDAKST